MTEAYTEFLSAIRQFLPDDRIYTDELRTLGWGTDASFYRQIPQIVIRSDSEQEVSRIVQTCRRYKLPFTFRAAGTSLSGQSCTDSILIVAGKHWEQYTVPSDGSTIKLQPGIVGARVNEILKPYGRVFPPDPASIGSAMVGGIVCNNASGMNCGVHANSDRMLLSARLILADGTVLDTGDEQSREAFRQSHPDFLRKIEALRDSVRADQQLAERIRRKYSIKNVTGLNLRPLIAYDDPFDIIAHLLVGSEGTLAFLSEVTMQTLRDYPYKASAMVYFLTMKESCEAVVAMKKLLAGDEDLSYSAEQLMVKSAEMLDYMSLSSVPAVQTGCRCRAYCRCRTRRLPQPDGHPDRDEGHHPRTAARQDSAHQRLPVGLPALPEAGVHRGSRRLRQVLGHPLGHLPFGGRHASRGHVLSYRGCRLPHRRAARGHRQAAEAHC